MNEKVQQLIDAVKAENMEQAKEIATELEPTEFDKYKEWFTGYSFVTGQLFGPDNVGEPTYNKALAFVKQIGPISEYGIENLANLMTILDGKLHPAEDRLICLAVLYNYQDVILEVVLPHLQDLGLYPSTLDSSDS